VLVAVGVTASSTLRSRAAFVESPASPHVKNVILMIGDGMGPASARGPEILHHVALGALMIRALDEPIH
jgi:alkaline phosphatase